MSTVSMSREGTEEDEYANKCRQVRIVFQLVLVIAR
jgi:hypothetical protein